MDTLLGTDAEIDRLEGPARGPGGPIVPVVLVGGSGTRLWPLSRESFPKQFWPLLSEQTMLQETLARFGGDDFASPIIVCNENHRFLVAEQLQAAGSSCRQILLEPVGRNSAPAIAAAAVLLSEGNPDAVLCLVAADSTIGDAAALRRALAVAAVCAGAGRIVTLGVRPSGPETGYGYIEAGRSLAGVPEAFAMTRFIEKPDRESAERLVASGRYLWNSGMYVATACTLLTELEAHAPEVLHHARRAVGAARRDNDFIWLGPEEFAACPAISLDVAVAERTSHGAVVPADLQWSDIGSWDSLWANSLKDENGNVVIGDTLMEGSEGCYARGDAALTAVVGLKNTIVVATRDVVLALHRDHAQSVKSIVERLRQAGRPEAVTHERVRRPWGYYESIAHGTRFQVKRILVNPGAELSLQKHFHRAEHWIVVEGTGLITRGEEEFLVKENESTFLPLGSIHKVKNPGRIPLVFVEVQCGAYLGEDDIVRLEDRYGRV